eukprot:3595412-Alexandrium_andersonii.AAC.1
MAPTPSQGPLGSAQPSQAPPAGLGAAFPSVALPAPLLASRCGPSLAPCTTARELAARRPLE